MWPAVHGASRTTWAILIASSVIAFIPEPKTRRPANSPKTGRRAKGSRARGYAGPASQQSLASHCGLTHRCSPTCTGRAAGRQRAVTRRREDHAAAVAAARFRCNSSIRRRNSVASNFRCVASAASRTPAAAARILGHVRDAISDVADAWRPSACPGGNQPSFSRPSTVAALIASC